MGKHGKHHVKKKKVLHNVEVPLTTKSACVLRPSAEVNEVDQRIPPILNYADAAVALPPESLPMPQATGMATASRFTQPELHTTLGICKKIERLANAAPALNSCITQLAPDMKKRLNAEITKQLNHNVNEAMFRKLVNVNDVLMDPEPAREQKKHASKHKMDPEPYLNDYLKPMNGCIIDFRASFLTPERAGNSVAISSESWNNFRNIRFTMRTIADCRAATGPGIERRKLTYLSFY